MSVGNYASSGVSTPVQGMFEIARCTMGILSPELKFFLNNRHRNTEWTTENTCTVIQSMLVVQSQT